MRFTYDRGNGSSDGKWLSLHLGPGAGYMRPVWTKRNKGPGLATEPGRDCGHIGLDHCWSAYCRRWFCQLHAAPVIGWLLRGHTLRIWCGPTWEKVGTLAWFRHARVILHSMGLKRQTNPWSAWLYSPVSFR